VSEHNRAVVIRPDIDPGGGAVASSKPGRQAPAEVAQLVMGDPLRCAVAKGAATPAPLGNNGRSRFDQGLGLVFRGALRHKTQLDAIRVEELAGGIKASGPGRVLAAAGCVRR